MGQNAKVAAAEHAAVEHACVELACVELACVEHVIVKHAIVTRANVKLATRLFSLLFRTNTSTLLSLGEVRERNVVATAKEMLGVGELKQQTLTGFTGSSGTSG